MKVKITNLKERNTWIQGKLIEPFKSRIIELPKGVELKELQEYSNLKVEEIKDVNEEESKKKRVVKPQEIIIKKNEEVK